MENPLNFIKQNDEELFEHIGKSREMAFKDGTIPAKYKYLIALAVDAVSRTESGVKSLAEMARQNGATKNEIMETLRITNLIGGLVSTYTAACGLKDL